MRILRLAAVPAAAMTLVLTTASAASGTNFAGCDAGEPEPCFANNSYHTATYNLGPRLYTATERTRIQSYETTDLTTAVDTGSTHDVNEDLHYGVDDNLPDGILGRYDCHYYLNGQRCTHAHIRYHGELLTGFSDDELQSLACHETGHSVGLRHPPVDDATLYGCMVNGAQLPRHLNPHNVSHIDGRY